MVRCPRQISACKSMPDGVAALKRTGDTASYPTNTNSLILQSRVLTSMLASSLAGLRL